MTANFLKYCQFGSVPQKTYGRQPFWESVLPNAMHSTRLIWQQFLTGTRIL